MKIITSYSLIGAVAIALSNAAVVSSEGWDSSVDFGLTLTRGNANTALFTSTLNLAKTVDKDQYLAGLGYTFGDNDGTSTNDELTGFLNWNREVSEDTYYGFRLEGRRDTIANVDYRVQATALYGYHFIKNDKTEFSIETGPGYTVQSLDGDKDSYAHFYLGQRASHWITENARVFQSLAGYLSLNEVERFNVIFVTGVEALMNESLSLKVTLENKYESLPAAGAEKNDLKLISGVSYKF